MDVGDLLQHAENRPSTPQGQEKQETVLQFQGTFQSNWIVDTHSTEDCICGQPEIPQDMFQ